MSTDISTNPVASAFVVQPVFHQAVEPRRAVPVAASTAHPHESFFDSKAIRHQVEQLNEFVKAMNHRLSFSIDTKTNDVIVKVIDGNTDKVIRELPPAELEKLHESIKEAVGLLIDKLI